MSSEGATRTRKWLTLVLGGIVFCFPYAGCSRRPQAGVERLAILPFENLGEDATLDWMGRAVAEVLATQIRGSRKIHPMLVTTRSDLRLSGATHVLYGYFFVLNDRIRLNASLEVVERKRISRRFSTEGPRADGVLPLAESIARDIEPRAQSFDTQSPDALKAYAEARSSSDPAAAIESFERAVAADSDFGLAYVGWAQALLVRGDRAGAERVIHAARERGERIGEIERAELDLLSAALREDPEARMRALATLSRLTPADIDVLRRLGRAQTAAHRYAAAVECYREATERDPANPLLWNDLGYAEAFARNLDGARKALREYARLAPEEANPLDSLGDVHFYLGQFASAETFYLQAYEKSSAFLGGATLYKAARARLMTGDVREADEVFRRFAAARRAVGDPIIECREAQWQHLSGRRRQARTRLAEFAARASVLPDVASQAFSQLSAWSLDRGDRQEARKYAARAIASASSPVTRSLAAICEFLAAAAGSPSELAAAARRGFSAPSQEQIRLFALGHSLLLGEHFQEAVPVLRQLYDKTDPASPEQVHVLLAWALVESGRFEEAAPVLDVYGIPPAAGEPAFVFLTFPRIFALRSVVLEKQGRLEEANADKQLFQTISGN